MPLATCSPPHSPNARVSAGIAGALDKRRATRPDRRSPGRDAPCAARPLAPETFLQRLARAVADARGGDAYALYVVHIEHFDGAETRGRDADAVLLRRLAPSLSPTLGGEICTGHLEHDRYSLLKAECRAAHAPMFARHIRSTLERDPFAWRGLAFRLGVSVGGAPLTGELEAEEVLERVNHACHAARDLDGVVMLRGEPAERAALDRELAWHEHLTEILG